ncbi:MAG: diacylglycerol kinase family protein [Bryobacteraceae bacterium]
MATVLIYNPKAGRLQRDEGLVTRVAEVLRPRHPDLLMQPTNAAGHATKLAADAVRSGATMVLVLGGDGTVNETINGMANSRVPLGVLPAGTANVLACELRMKRNAEAVARSLPEFEAVRIALGKLRTGDGAARHFLLMAGVGLDAAVLDRVDPAMKDRRGKLAYWWAGLSMLGKKLVDFEVLCDGRSLKTTFALAARVRNYGGDLNIAARASLFDERLELVTFDTKSTWPYAMYLAGAVVGQATTMPGASSMMTRRIEFRPLHRAPVYTQIDGEKTGPLPAIIEAVPDALTLMVPRRNG